MSEYLTNTEDLTTVANAIRAKSGQTGQLIYPDGFASAVAGIKKAPTGPYMDVEYVAVEDVSGYTDHYIKRAKLYNHTAIYMSEFINQSKLSSVDFSDVSNSITAVEYLAFSGANVPELILPDTITTLSPYCFSSAIIKTLTIPPLVTVLSTGAFQYVQPFVDFDTGEETPTSIILPQNLVKIDQSCFEGAPIQQITIPNTVTEIGERAFSYCQNLASIVLSTSLQKISNAMLQGCTSLTEITIPASVTEIGQDAFGGTGITHIIIPATVTALGQNVLMQCSSLATIDIQANVTEIPASFAIESGRTSITLPDTVQTIGVAAFATGSASLTEITIPASVTSIGSDAFYQPNPMTTITCLATTPPTLNGNNVFQIDSNTVIKVPSASVAAYKAATNWSNYADYIVGV